jgi:hypothetical protein
MTITKENINQSNIIEQQETEMLSSLLFHSISLVPTDDESSIAHKIEILTSLKDYLIKNIDIDSLSSDAQELNYIRILSKITVQIENFEIIIGRKDIESLKRAAKRFAKRTQY